MSEDLTSTEREMVRRAVEGPTELEKGAEIAGQCREIARELLERRKRT